MATIGLMEGAFFVGRKEIMDWVNSTLALNLAKVEDTANGAPACQLLDIMYPGQVPMHKVNWDAKKDFEFVANYKILQTCFTKLGIDRHIDVPRLISGRYMDNLEFMQWFKRFFEMNVSDKGDYDCIGQRSKGKGGDKFGGGKVAAASATAKPASAPSKAGAATKTGASKTGATSAAGAGAKGTTKSTGPSARPAGKGQENSQPNKMPAKSATGASKGIAAGGGADSSKDKNAELEKANEDLRTEMEGLEKERDFYFEKLREVEILLQDIEEKNGSSEMTASIFKILYATAEGFEPVPEPELEDADPVGLDDEDATAISGVADAVPVASSQESETY